MIGRSEFIWKWKHELRGIVLDGMKEGGKGSESSLWLRGAELKIDAALATMYDQLTKEKSDAKQQPTDQTEEGAKARPASNGQMLPNPRRPGAGG